MKCTSSLSFICRPLICALRSELKNLFRVKEVSMKTIVRKWINHRTNTKYDFYKQNVLMKLIGRAVRLTEGPKNRSSPICV